MVSGGEVAGLIVAVFWAVLVGFLAYVLIRLGQVLKETTRLVGGVTDRTIPLIEEVTTSVSTANVQLGRVDAITSNVQSITTNATALSSLFAATLGGPVVKVAAFTYGVRRALRDRMRRDVEKRVRTELKSERAAGRAERVGRVRRRLRR